MREIKFRGQRQSDNKWIYGDLLQPVEICDIYEISDCESIDGSRYDVVEDTIGQYTGIKDKNGKEIYEGDILREYDNEIQDWIVSYEYGKFIGTWDNVCEDLYELIDLEVIGNIYDK